MNSEADESTREPETLGGIRPYRELVPALALGVERVMASLVGQRPGDLRFSFEGVLALHEAAFREVVPRAGRIRTRDVQVGQHLPPAPYHVRELLRDFADTLEFRVRGLESGVLDPHEVAEVFASCEGRFTHVHPFSDFNGRVARLLSWMLVLRLGLPSALPLVPSEGDVEGRRRLFDALHAFDQGRRRPLERIWYERLASSLGQLP